MTDETGTGGAEHSSPGEASFFGSDAWEQLKVTHDPRTFAQSWLDIQCVALGPGVVLQAVVILGAPDKGPFAPIAIWPKGSLGSPRLAKAAEDAIGKRTEVYRSGGSRGLPADPKQKSDALGYPLMLDGQVCGAVAVEVQHGDETAGKKLMEQLQWGSGWLEALVRRGKFTTADRLVTVLQLIATSLYHERFQAAATAVATELAGVLHCERVTVGFLQGEHSKVRAVSHTASFGKKANVVRAVEAAMDEAIDQQATVLYPSLDDGPMQVTRAHEVLVKEHKTGAICTVPFSEGERILGALVLERTGGEKFDSITVQLCEHAAALLGPLLDIKRKDDRWLIQKAGDSLRDYLQKLIGPRHTILKAISYSLLFLLVFFSFVDGDYRVTADASLEGAVQRAISAPLAGYIGEANVRAGDTVKAGDVLFTLDDRDLLLEKLKWTSQRAQHTSEYREAVARRDRARAQILEAQVEQADAQIGLIEEQLKRARVVAPFDGYVVSGDLSQSLSAPVERGDVLFEVAPLNAYRVVLKVDERDVGQMQPGETGNLALTGAPGDTFPIVVDKITPVATTEEGRNYFRVEASLAQEDLSELRPGMEGVGKVHVGERKLIWIWTHKIGYWWRMFWWSWWP